MKDGMRAVWAQAGERRMLQRTALFENFFPSKFIAQPPRLTRRAVVLRTSYHEKRDA
jgi:hypothetical protein